MEVEGCGECSFSYLFSCASAGKGEETRGSFVLTVFPDLPLEKPINYLERFLSFPSELCLSLFLTSSVHCGHRRGPYGAHSQLPVGTTAVGDAPGSGGLGAGAEGGSLGWPPEPGWTGKCPGAQLFACPDPAGSPCPRCKASLLPAEMQGGREEGVLAWGQTGVMGSVGRA